MANVYDILQLNLFFVFFAVFMGEPFITFSQRVFFSFIDKRMFLLVDFNLLVPYLDVKYISQVAILFTFRKSILNQFKKKLIMYKKIF